MVLSDYLSRQMGHKTDLHQIISISFNIREVSLKGCQNKAKDTFMFQTRSQAKGVKPPMKRTTTDSTKQKKVQDIKPLIIEDEDQNISNQTETNSSTVRNIKSPIKCVPNQIYPQPAIRPPPRPQDPSKPNHKVTAGVEPNLDFEENSPHQEGIITETYKSPDKSYLEQPQELSDLVDSTKLIHKYLLKQVDIDKIMDIIKRKVLKGTHIPLTIK